MRRIWMAVLACVLLWLPFAMASATPVEVRIKGRIQIGPDGSVVDYRPSREIPAAVEDALQATVLQWKFEPVVIDGRAVTAETGMLLVLNAWQKGDGLALRVKDVAFGAQEGGPALSAPRYPPEALRSGVEGRVVVLMRVDVDGDVLEAVVEQTSISSRVKARHAPSYVEVFEAAAINAALRWRFGSRESIDGVPVEGTVRTPVEFVLGKTLGDLAPGEVRTAPWRRDRAPASGAELAALPGGETMTLDSVFRLLDTVVGVELGGMPDTES